MEDTDLTILKVRLQAARETFRVRAWESDARECERLYLLIRDRDPEFEKRLR